MDAPQQGSATLGPGCLESWIATDNRGFPVGSEVPGRGKWLRVVFVEKTLPTSKFFKPEVEGSPRFVDLVEVPNVGPEG